MKTILSLSLSLALGLALTSCAATADYESFGAGVESYDGIAAAEVIANPAMYEGQTVRVTGPVQSVCKVKGCWMKIGEGDETMRVKFVDYGFFMPLDCEGRTAVMEGTVSVNELSLEETKHYLKDAGELEKAENVTEPATEITFVASGVALKK